MTRVLNGNRFLYIESLLLANRCVGSTIVVASGAFYFITGNLRLLNICSAQIAGLLTIQEKTVKMNQNEVCKKSDHTPGDRKCDSYEVQQNIIAFIG